MVGNALRRHPYGEMLDRLAAQPIWREREAEKARAAAGNPRRHRACLRQHRFRQRLRSRLRAVEVNPRRPHRVCSRGGRDGHRHRDGARRPGGRRARRGRRRGAARAIAAAAPSTRHRAIPTPWRKRTRTKPRRTRAGFPPSAHRQAHPSALMSAPTAQTRPPTSSSASACGPPPSTCGRFPEPTRLSGNGIGRAGGDGSCTRSWPPAPDSRGSRGAGAHARRYHRRDGARL